MRFLLTLILTVLAFRAQAMTVKPDGDQLVLSGPVFAGDFERIRGALDVNPAVTTIIPRDSPGGDAPTGYQVGELVRARRLRTAV